MKIETKRRIAAFVGYPAMFLFGLLDSDEKQKKDTAEYKELFRDRIFGRRLL